MRISTSSSPRPSTLYPQQSPIDLKEAVYAPGLQDQVDIGWSDSDALPITPKHGHGADLPGEQQALTLNGKPFEPKGFHFHAHSEHLVNGSPYPMELHIVHQNDDDGTRAVVGIFIDDQGTSGSKSDNSVRSLIDSLEGQKSATVSPSDLLPESTEQFYRYEGSLTTPPYDENVSWLVMREPIHVAPETLARLKDEQGHEARPAQDINRRFVLANFSEPA